ncbi:MAG: hypothetical protein GY703_15690 [Gammaproteobacteria bacterium]|nr:hypothetical protein [Gammaproteobacteria bacterium]
MSGWFGFILGSGLTVALLIFYQQSGSFLVGTGGLPLLSGIATCVREKVDPVVVPAEPVELSISQEPASTAEPLTAAAMQSVPDSLEEQLADLPKPLPEPEQQPREPNDPEWFSFWKPFRNRYMAQGFASRLSTVTKVPFAVQRTGISRYEVVFDYRSESERLQLIERIAGATGLLVGEGGQP